MTNPIVTVQVSVQQAPTPNLLQKRGALLTQGGTSLTAKTYSFLSQASDLTPLLPAALDITSVAWSSGLGGQATVTTAVAHGVAVGQVFPTTIAGVVPVGYNGTVFATATGASTFTYPLVANPGSMTTAGTYTRRGVAELQSMVTTFFAQGASQGVYVLELGVGEPSAGVTALGEFITDNVQFFYSYLVPRAWDGVSSFVTFLGNYTATTAKTMFFVTTIQQYYALYEDLKCVDAMLENFQNGVWAQGSVSNATWAGGVATVTVASHGVVPGDTFTLTGILPAGYNGTYVARTGTATNSLIFSLASDPGAYSSGGTLIASPYASAGVPATQFSHAADIWKTLNWSPGPSNQVSTLAFTYLQGVTEIKQQGTQALLSTLKAAYVNYVGNGGEGGISNKALFWGTVMDGRPFNYWYSIDWAQIQAQLYLANAVFNGSNTNINPLYMNQFGIDRLQQAVVSMANLGIASGLMFGRIQIVSLPAADFRAKFDDGEYAGTVVINAVPFNSYYSLAPSDYRAGIYGGLFLGFAPARGFDSILINIEATDIVASPA